MWHKLPPEQRQKLEHWLFVEHVSYQEAVERAQKEWGVTGSTVSLCRFYQRVEEEHVVEELERAAEMATGVAAAQGRLSSLQASAMKVVGMRMMQNVVSRGDVKELAVLSRVLARNEERKIQHQRLALAREKFEFRAAKAVVDQLPHLEKMAREDQGREDARINATRKGIFGTRPADIIYEY
ncbi:MAG TPA: hypothetical protein VFC07_15640 [Verrucomicrobiae bacterium]|nr:hypothetical protein [Verrucomicrobiae bacterium]